jgi:hypothetical protein
MMAPGASSVLERPRSWGRAEGQVKMDEYWTSTAGKWQ